MCGIGRLYSCLPPLRSSFCCLSPRAGAVLIGSIWTFFGLVGSLISLDLITHPSNAAQGRVELKVRPTSDPINLRYIEHIFWDAFHNINQESPGFGTLIATVILIAGPILLAAGVLLLTRLFKNPVQLKSATALAITGGISHSVVAEWFSIVISFIFNYGGAPVGLVTYWFLLAVSHIWVSIYFAVVVLGYSRNIQMSDGQNKVGEGSGHFVSLHKWGRPKV